MTRTTHEGLGHFLSKLQYHTNGRTFDLWQIQRSPDPANLICVSFVKEIGSRTRDPPAPKQRICHSIRVSWWKYSCFSSKRNTNVDHFPLRVQQEGNLPTTYRR
ncbi:hypothetical protein AVEN_165577-1 [Araneus ventricosus]|uniref:Uncharacterized protein n=1 Tax=Araneus ventricosus TaxID=182803 RepID=A0A4Y2EMA9_ARAVE|nr:hypothetical protein AVEN_165577-1 [Araneus ventricosus]